MFRSAVAPFVCQQQGLSAKAAAERDRPECLIHVPQGERHGHSVVYKQTSLLATPAGQGAAVTQPNTDAKRMPLVVSDIEMKSELRVERQVETEVHYVANPPYLATPSARF